MSYNGRPLQNYRRGQPSPPPPPARYVVPTILPMTMEKRECSIWWLAILSLFLCGCAESQQPVTGRRAERTSSLWRRPPAPPELPQANLPLESRQQNYNRGSCGCASTISALRWLGLDDAARQMRQICSGGQSGQSLAQKLDRLGVRYVATYSGDASVLDWACRTRRQAVIGFKANHICTLVGKTPDGRYIVLDNNRTRRYELYSDGDFRRLWHGFAIVPLGAPSPPL